MVVVATVTHQSAVATTDNNRCAGRVDLALLAVAAALFLDGLAAVMFTLETLEGYGLYSPARLSQ